MTRRAACRGSHRRRHTALIVQVWWCVGGGCRYLAQAGLGRYIEAFRTAGVDEPVFRKLLMQVRAAEPAASLLSHPPVSTAAKWNGWGREKHSLS